MAFTQLRENLFQGRLPELRRLIANHQRREPETKEIRARRKLFRLTPFELGTLRAEGYRVVVTEAEFVITPPIVWVFPFGTDRAPEAESEKSASS